MTDSPLAQIFRSFLANMFHNAAVANRSLLMVQRRQFWSHVSGIVDGYYFFGAALFVFDTGFLRSRRVEESAALNG